MLLCPLRAHAGFGKKPRGNQARLEILQCSEPLAEAEPGRHLLALLTLKGSFVFSTCPAEAGFRCRPPRSAGGAETGREGERVVLEWWCICSLERSLISSLSVALQHWASLRTTVPEEHCKQGLESSALSLESRYDFLEAQRALHPGHMIQRVVNAFSFKSQRRTADTASKHAFIPKQTL